MRSVVLKTWLCLVGLMLIYSVVEAQQPPPPVQPNPQAPSIAPPFPLGVQRGTTLDLNLTGANLADPVNLMTSFPAKVTIPAENNNGKDNAKLLVRLDVPKDAPLGWHTIRLATTRGVSQFRMFCIDDLPQVLEDGDKNRSLATAQAVPVPCVVCGKTDAEISDYFKFTVQAGQRLSFEVLARRLGGSLQQNRPFDPRISLIDVKGGKELAYSDDAPGQGKDPRLTYTFKEAGEYALELRDVGWAGSGDWFYRLRIGDFPCATTPVPLAVKRGGTVTLTFAGPNVEGAAPMTTVAPTTPETEVIWLAPQFTPTGVPGWPVPLIVTDLDEAVETEPNDEPAKAMKLTVPGAVSGRLQKKGDRDFFSFAAQKGQRYIIEALTQEFQSPTSIYMVLRDAMGAQVAASNPANDPARIDFTAPADAEYTLMVEHLHYWGGPEESYRLTITKYQPGFTLTAGIDRFDVPQGAGTVMTIQAARRDYTGPIEVSVAFPPEISGTATIPAGQGSTLMVLTAAPDLQMGGSPLVLVGKATINNQPVVERCDVRTIVSTNLANLPFPPRHLTKQLAIGVAEKPPFKVTASVDLAEALRGGTVPVTITATKEAGFDEEIAIASLNVPPPQGQPVAFPPVQAKIPKGMTQVKVELKPAANAPLGAVPTSFTGKAKFMNRDYSVAAVPVPLQVVLPFDLQVDTAGGKIATEDKHKIKVKAVRKAGYKGPIALEVQNLPAGVTAPKATLAEGQDEIEVELTAAANATVGDKADVKVLGTAPAAANQQNASANFTVSVVKK